MLNNPNVAKNEEACSNLVNARTITCKPGYWAQGPGQVPPDPDVVIFGLEDSAGCACVSFPPSSSDLRQ